MTQSKKQIKEYITNYLINQERIEQDINEYVFNTTEEQPLFLRMLDQYQELNFWIEYIENQYDQSYFFETRTLIKEPKDNNTKDNTKKYILVVDANTDIYDMTVYELTNWIYDIQQKTKLIQDKFNK